MATKTFLGSQHDVAQVGTITITTWAVDTDSFNIVIGDAAKNLTVTITAKGDTDTTLTATALVAAWNASTHPYAKYITATSAAAVITLTADNPGNPFTIDATSVTGGGGGVIGSYTAVTASVSGSDVADAANYDTGTLPVATDKIIHAKGAPAMAWGLESLAALATCSLEHENGAGNIGLARMAFAFSSDGQEFDAERSRGFLGLGQPGQRVVIRDRDRCESVLSGAFDDALRRI